jgi:iron complex transport system substrate-binding protein
MKKTKDICKMLLQKKPGVKYLFLIFSCVCTLQTCVFPKKETGNTTLSYISFRDSAERQVHLPQEIKKIAPAGSAAQMFLAVIAPDLLCSLSVPLTGLEKKYLPPIGDLPVTGQFYGQGAFNPEEIARIAPDVIIDIGELKEGIANNMDGITKAAGIPAIHITADIRSAPEAFRTLGKLLNREGRGGALAAFCEETLRIAESIMSDVGNSKKKALFCLGPRGMNVLAKGSFHSEIFDLMTENLAELNNPSARATGNEINPEQLLLMDPDIIIFGPECPYREIEKDPLWRQLHAIKNRDYYRVPEGPYNWMGSPPSINRYLGILWLAKQLYPEYAQYDPGIECGAYFELFYGYTFSSGEFEKLVSGN